MYRLISGLVAGAILLAPVLPARADFGIRSSSSGVTIVTHPSFGQHPRGFRRSYYPYGGSGVVIRSTIDNSYYNYGQPKYYSPGFPTRTVIVAPKVRTIILNPVYPNNPYPNNSYRQGCGSVIYGSPISSPIPVDPYTGVACR
ncbi:hypothetical protein Q2T42_04160 [Leptolyngbya boryana CZ1]|uniref:Uncharacterized protein n=1 Tax=Leptolyngbya boryana CZ1 TaxID=3060204 RepID=A0AA96WXZ6_LEPBY|nr:MULTISPECIES: hypothetical protein [Leptolyngbya]MBD1858252.1 hypothetical protein [Leptolyngbya sp. FACHB-1624]MBN8564635.1 hypothetical protein [Leptolyngbya sp. UWPOB_LEPTO1]WNZ47028.1 hypothetical protein Q2T42_04160 [Leptolyngbya boryana CZ1]